MKKYLSGIGSFLGFCFLSLFILCAAGVLSSGSDSLFGDAVYFSHDGDVLSFFGETLYISESSVKSILDYPGEAVDFTMSFLPVSLRGYVDTVLQNVSKDASEFFGFIGDCTEEFLRLGT